MADVKPAYSQSNACNLAINGSFESPNVQTDPQRPGENTSFFGAYAIWRTTTYPLDGWQTVSGTVDLLRHHSNASDGMQSIDLWGTAAATLRQTFTGLVPGQQYTFSIDYAGQSATQSIASVQLGNGNGVAPVALATLRPVADSVSNGGGNLPTTPVYTQTWATYQHTFTAAGTEATIQFVNSTAPGPANTGLFIDNFTFAGAEPCADLSITKTDGATTFTRGSNITYTIVVNNGGTADAPGTLISDPLPGGITAANWTCGGATGGAVCSVASGTGAINTTADLPAGSSVTYTLNMTVPAGYSGVNLTNTATVTAPGGISDPDTSNNTASDTNVVSPPQPSFGSCDANMYMAQSTGSPPTTLYQFDTASNPFVFNPLGSTAGHAYNAIAMNPVDNYIYAMSTNGTQTVLLRIGSNGQAVNLGVVSGGGINVGLTAGHVYNNGEIGPDGSYYVLSSAVNTSTLFRINLATLTATAIPLSQAPITSDIAWHNGLLYGRRDATGQLYSINPSTGAVAPVGSSSNPPVGGAFGAMIGATNGVFGGNNSGGFYQFDLTTGALTLISSSPGAGNNDGAKCVTTALGFPADTQITKSDNSTVYSPGTDVTYTIVVTNDGPFGVQGAAVNDPLPAGITTANWVCVGAGGGVCGAASGTGAISTTANLPIGGTVTYTLTMNVPAGFTGDLVNTATVTNPPGTPDPDTSSNTSTDTNQPGTPSLSVEKTGTLNDLDGDGLIDLGETISYSFRVTNNGNVLMSDVTVTDPLLAGAGVSVSPGPQTLAPGGSVVFTATYSPSQAEIDAGQVSNSATGTGTPPSGPPIDSPPDSVVVPPDQTPGLTIEKNGTLNDLDGDGLLDLGETISYSFRATNTGAVTLTGVTVNDPLLTNAGVSVTPGPQTLGPRGSAVFTATYTPTQAEIDAGQVSNTATGTGTPPSGPPIDSPPDTVVVPPDQASGLTIEKTGTLNDLDNDGFIDPGETISYSFLATNTGAVTLTDVTVNDPLLANAGISVTPGPQTLAPGANVTFTATYTPTQAEIDAGQVSNTATGTGTPPSGPPITSPPDTVVVPPDQTPGMTIDKTGTLNDLDGDGLIDLGETISYSFRATNTGAVTLTGVTINDPLLSNAGISVTPGPQTLAPGGSATFTATYTPTQADIDASQVSNTATGTGTPPSGPPIDSPPDTVVVPPDQTPGMTIDKTGTLNDLDGDGLLDLGETIGYSFRVTNTGAVTLTGVTVNDPLLQNAGISVSPGPLTLGPGGSATFTATYTPSQADIDAGRVSNSATGTGTPPSGPPVTSPPDTVVVPPDQTTGMAIEKTGALNDLDGDGLIDLGETISYAFLVTNTGTVTLTGVTVDDPLLANAGVSVSPGPQVLAPGANVTFTATYTPSQADIDAGRVENSATGTGTPPSGPPVTSPPDTVVVPPDQTPGLSIEKTGALNDLDGDGLLDPGETISYSFLARNTGAVTLTDVTIDDPLLANAGIAVTPGPQTLAPGANVTFTAVYTPTQAEIDAGAVENSATGTGTAPGGGVTTSPPDSVTVPPQPASLALVKTGSFGDLDGNGYASVGDTLTYTFTVTNDGGQTAADVWPKDPGPTFGGQPGTGRLSAFTPAAVALSPGQQIAFTATYTLTETDVVNAAGAADGVANTATAIGYIKGNVITGTPVESEESRSLVTLPAAASDISVAKVALLRHIRRGEEAPFAITITNNSASAAQGLTVVDTLPSGFRYVEGSATIGGVAVTPIIDGRRVVFENVAVPANGAVEIRLRMLALSSAGPGEHVNRASVTDSSGNPLAPDATATVEIVIEPIFDCSEIIGRVFDDKNRNGYQDEGELGLPGVRLATVKGWLVTTDAHGRFHVACAALPDQRIGSNFIMKLDPRTLPTGYRLTTENPRVVRLTAGKMTSLDFGVAIGRVVRLDLQDQAFEAGSTELRPQWAQGVDQLIGVLDQEQSVLRLTYFDPGPDTELAEERLRQVSGLIRERWEHLSGQYRLEIEMRVESGL
ncbi:MAG TPA: choice-of-anchor D domain-containing protein [Devosia sp.]|nr:choice-of-anchor D domain-containing protein [Devosia sp.]